MSSTIFGKIRLAFLERSRLCLSGHEEEQGGSNARKTRWFEGRTRSRKSALSRTQERDCTEGRPSQMEKGEKGSIMAIAPRCSAGPSPSVGGVSGGLQYSPHHLMLPRNCCDTPVTYSEYVIVLSSPQHMEQMPRSNRFGVSALQQNSLADDLKLRLSASARLLQKSALYKPLQYGGNGNVFLLRRELIAVPFDMSKQVARTEFARNSIGDLLRYPQQLATLSIGSFCRSVFRQCFSGFQRLAAIAGNHFLTCHKNLWVAQKFLERLQFPNSCIETGCVQSHNRGVSQKSVISASGESSASPTYARIRICAYSKPDALILLYFACGYSEDSEGRLVSVQLRRLRLLFLGRLALRLLWHEHSLAWSTRKN